MSAPDRRHGCGVEKGSGVIVFTGLFPLSTDGPRAADSTPGPDVWPSAAATTPRRTARRGPRSDAMRSTRPRFPVDPHSCQASGFATGPVSNGGPGNPSVARPRLLQRHRRALRASTPPFDLNAPGRSRTGGCAGLDPAQRECLTANPLQRMLVAITDALWSSTCLSLSAQA